MLDPAITDFFEERKATWKKSKIKDSMTRKQLYCMMLDMFKENDLSGAQLFEICIK